ncbi:hypothetical protein SAMN04488030_2600 [Aliiroseovarius halocynthiae]|uniref:Uncharacterized protein n=1 Tax=Aliiroseovarius halocynthiae TaxID=985055 RepID=A0A545SPX8_9RHOB|nr:hypothetical protein [Aliiroseovarius halocynthiae]TQV67028.1 hypothetical protein FIL88_10585 [Aliiroseovarius halocynthiae]SMR82253.1 hypothetical protein SAMN04488030_2600 [Aliiroseovarius halocynthiae]
MTLNRSEIMKAAWKATQERMDTFGYARRQLRSVFAYCLRRAWAEAKAAAALLARSAASLWAELLELENRDRLGFRGIERLSQLRRAYEGAKAREAEAQAQVDHDEKRELIQSAGGRFASVTFIKKDGSTCVMLNQPAKLKYHVKGDEATPSARKAIETRKARHPHLLSVWDADKAAPRSVNLSTVTEIRLDGLAHVFEVAA